MFFRSLDEADHPVLNNKFISRVLRPPKTSDIYSYMRQKATRSTMKRPQSATQSRDEVSMSLSLSSDPGLSLKRQLLEEITTNRIYTDKDLDDLFLRAREANSHLSPDLVEDAIAYVQNELDS